VPERGGFPPIDALPARRAGLPLLQPGTRRLVKRAFASAARVLKGAASPLARLRAQLHLELARCEAADDALVKVRAARALGDGGAGKARPVWGASRGLQGSAERPRPQAAKEVQQALALDYCAPEEEQAQAGHERPLDRCGRGGPAARRPPGSSRACAWPCLTQPECCCSSGQALSGKLMCPRPLYRHLLALERALKARAGQDEGGGLEDGALALLERARGSDAPALRADYLSKCGCGNREKAGPCLGLCVPGLLPESDTAEGPADPLPGALRSLSPGRSASSPPCRCCSRRATRSPPPPAHRRSARRARAPASGLASSRWGRQEPPAGQGVGTGLFESAAPFRRLFAMPPTAPPLPTPGPKAAWDVRLDAVVLDAAPFTLAAPWSAAVDREMAALQAEVALIEAEAAWAALRWAAARRAAAAAGPGHGVLS
jgi:hypothetical protein